MCHIPTMEYYSVVNMNEVLMHATTQVSLENTVVRERIQTQPTCFMIPFIRNIQNRQIHKDRKQVSGCQAAMERDRLVGTGFPLRVISSGTK